MKTRLKTLLAVALVLVTAPMASHADLTISLSDDGAGGTDLQFDGSGIVLIGGDFAYESLGVDFFSPGGGESSPILPTAVLGGASVTTFFAGLFGAAGQSIEWFWPGVSVGAPLDDADGLTFNLPDLAFADFNPGSYALTRFNGFADVGAVTLIIDVVPEPSTASLVSLGLLGIAAARRRRGAAY
jgi:hypothetical protein